METMRTVKVSTKRKRRLDQQLATLDAKKKHLKEVMGHFNDPQDIIKNIKGQGLSASTMQKRVATVRQFLAYLPMEDEAGENILLKKDRKKLEWCLKQFSITNAAEKEAAVAARHASDKALIQDQFVYIKKYAFYHCFELTFSENCFYFAECSPPKGT